jgi:4-hydroxybenzoate polyprenyltransferase
MKALDFIFAARPLLHLPIWSVYLVSLHYHNRLSGASFSRFDLLILACLSLLFAGAAYLNQLYDQESDRINDKIGFLQRGFVTPSQLWKAFMIVSILPLAIAPFLSPVTLTVFAQLFILAWIYSAPPLRLKDRPIGGLLANAWSIGFLVSIAAAPVLTLTNAGYAQWYNPLYFFFCVGGTYVLTTIADRVGDAAAQKLTLAVRLGRGGSLAVAALLFVGATLVAYKADNLVLAYLGMVALALTIAAVSHRSERSVLLAAKLPILLLTLLAGCYFPGYAVFVVALLVGTRVYYRRRFGVTYPKLS